MSKMTFQTPCSLHLVFSQPADVAGSVTRLTEFLGDQEVPAQVSASGIINNVIEDCLPCDRFTEITLRVDSLELRLEIATSSPKGCDGRIPFASGMEGVPCEELLAMGLWSHRGQAVDRTRRNSRPCIVALPELCDCPDLKASEERINFMASAITIPIL
jgi:hypothetical protein